MWAIVALAQMTTVPTPEHTSVVDMTTEDVEQNKTVIVTGKVIKIDGRTLHLNDNGVTVYVNTQQITTSIELINRQVVVTGEWDGYTLVADSIVFDKAEIKGSQMYRFRHQIYSGSIIWKTRKLYIDVNLAGVKHHDCLHLQADLYSNTIIGYDVVDDHLCRNSY